ncbi:hypothetical protein ACFQZZ_24260 [Nocardia sp. GCM10030253]|uniref:hypothetical protein n=1 Tax=Nocardia sp. GCM10030253 TaxID=3273404 RepID=UPI003629FA05
MSELICQYCSHRNIGGAISRCTHCGAPLRAAVHKASAAVESTAHVVEKTAGAAETAVKVVAGFPRWQWRALGVLIAVVVGLGVVVARSCSVSSLPSFSVVPEQTAVSALPEALRSGASCAQLSATEMGQKCVIGASHPLLAGGIAGGKELTFSTQVSLPASLSDTIRRWRAAGGTTVLADGPVFTAIGPSATVWYADTRSGLRLETGTFTGKAAAQTFLTRAGLVR